MTRIERNLPYGSQVNTDLIREDQSNQRHPRSIPPNWSWVKLGDVCEVVRGGSPRPMGDPKYFVGDIPFIKISDITKDESKFVIDSHTKVNKAGVKKSRFLTKGSLILSNSGSVCIPKFLGVDACIHDGFVSFVNFNTDVDLNFLYHFFNYTRPYVIQKHKQGITQVNLNTTIVSEFEIPLPPLPEQKKIVEKIEELFSKLDSGVASLKKAKEQLRLYRQSVLSAAFSGRLTREVGSRQLAVGKKEMLKAAEPKVDYKSNGLPEGWKWVKVKDICRKIIGGGTPSTKVEEYWKGNIDWITSADIYGIKDIRPRKKINKKAIENSATTLLPKGNIVVVTRVGLGKVAINKNDLCFSQDSQGIILDEKIVFNEYALWYLSNAVQVFKYKNRGTTIKGVTKKQLADLEFLLPPQQIQLQIVSEIEKRFSEADNLEKAIDESLEKSEALRQSILKQAFEGKLV